MTLWECFSSWFLRRRLPKLHKAVVANNLKKVKQLLDTGANIEQTALEDERRPLHLAAAAGRNEIVSLLLSYGADPFAQTTFGLTPVDFAIMKYQPITLSILLNFDARLANYAHNFGIVDIGICPPLLKAVDYNHIEAAKLLFQHKADPNLHICPYRGTVLHAAIMNHNLPFVKLLVEGGADPTIEATVGNALATATGLYVHGKLRENIKKIVFEMIAYLLDQKVPADSRWITKKTGLMAAIEDTRVLNDDHSQLSFGDVNLMRLFLKHGADPNLGFGDKLPIGAAACNHNTEAVRLLLEYGANPYLKDKSGKTAFDYAKDHQDIMLALNTAAATYVTLRLRITLSFDVQRETSIAFLNQKPNNCTTYRPERRCTAPHRG